MTVNIALRIPALLGLAALLCQAQVELSPLGCSQEPGMRSQNSATAASVEFINATGQPAKTYWLDFNGQRIFYQDIPAGSGYEQPTYLTHPWVVTDSSDRCLAIFLPIAGSARARVGSTALRLTLSSTAVVGGASISATVSLNAPADGAGVPVTLSANNSAAQPPAGIIVQPGLLTATFTIPTTAVAALQTALITATRQSDTAVALLTITPPVTSPQLAPATLTFFATAGSQNPAPQSISFVPGPQSQLGFSAAADSGADNSPTPSWISLLPASGTAPANISVTLNTAGLQPGTHSARVVVTPSSGARLTAPVSLVVLPATPPALDVAPASLSFFGTATGLAGSTQSLLVRNPGGGGSIPFRATVISDSPWLSVSPATGQTSTAGPVAVQAHLNTQTLNPGVYAAEIRVESGTVSAVIPVSVLINSAGPVLSLDHNGFRIDARTGQGSFVPRQLLIRNPGSGVANWAAELVAGSNWLNLQPTSGTATPTTPGVINLSLTNGSLSAGSYYALIRLSDPGALNSPQYVTGVLNMTASSAPPVPEPSPAGLFFTTAGTVAPAQTVRVYVSSVSPVEYRAAATTHNGGTWLSVTPSSGSASTAQPAQLSVTVNRAGLPPGIYKGEIGVSFLDNSIRAVNVTFVVQPPIPAASRERLAAGCTPSALTLTESALVNSFSAASGWPTPILVRVNDNCGDPVGNAHVIVSFSNGDPPLPLRLVSPQVGLYSGTWAPVNVISQVTLTARAIAPSLASAVSVLNGSVLSSNAPVLRPSGPILNNLNPRIGEPLAPGTVVQVHGSGLATAAVEPGVLPLPIEHNGTRFLAGFRDGPLYYLSATQLNAQLPSELVPGREYSVVVGSLGAFTQPASIFVTSVKPGLAAFGDGRLIAQHVDYSLVTSEAPARPGELIVVYLVGMGATDPPVASGAQAPSGPLASTVLQPVVTIGGHQCVIDYAGLTPGAVGLYQINLRVPQAAAAGEQPFVVKQGTAVANETRIPIAR